MQVDTHATLYYLFLSFANEGYPFLNNFKDKFEWCLNKEVEYEYHEVQTSKTTTEKFSQGQNGHKEKIDNGRKNTFLFSQAIFIYDLLNPIGEKGDKTHEEYKNSNTDHIKLQE